MTQRTKLKNKYKNRKQHYTKHQMQQYRRKHYL